MHIFEDPEAHYSDANSIALRNDFHIVAKGERLRPISMKVLVTYKNIGAGILSDLRYRRSIDWDVGDGAGNLECIDIVTRGVGANVVEFASNGAFLDADPRDKFSAGVIKQTLNCSLGGGACPVIGYGPRDQGIDFMFYFNSTDGVTPFSLFPGERISFKVYFGAAKDRTAARNSLNLLPDSVGVSRLLLLSIW
jgi:hypothetical protein